MDIREQQQATSTTRHPWERARRRVVQRLVARHAPRAHRVVDIGAGDGFVAEAFVARGCQVVAVDPAASAAHLDELRRRGIDARTALHNDRTADVALLLDVIEHVDDDVVLLRQAAQQLAPTGIIVVTVPAWPTLFSAHDTALGHHRRYTPQALRAALDESGLVVVDEGALFASLLVPRALQVVRERLRPTAGPSTLAVGQFRAPAFVATGITAMLDVDARLTARLGLPGLSLFAVARQKRP